MGRLKENKVMSKLEEYARCWISVRTQFKSHFDELASQYIGAVTEDKKKIEEYSNYYQATKNCLTRPEGEIRNVK